MASSNHWVDDCLEGYVAFCGFDAELPLSAQKQCTHDATAPVGFDGRLGSAELATMGQLLFFLGKIQKVGLRQRTVTPQ